MTWWEALILGVVEGLTEYLPVSSTGHLILVAWLLGFDDSAARWEAVNSFNIVIQAGAIAAVLGLYYKRVQQMLRGLIGQDDEGRQLAFHLVLAFLPAAMIGPFAADPIDEYLFRPWPVVGALFAGAWLMIAVAYSSRLPNWKEDGDKISGGELPDMNWKMALLIGFGQCVAMWPGTSRSMMTIVAALLLGMRPRAAAEFSFLLGVITLGAATCYEAVFGGGTQMLGEFGAGPIIIGFVAATVSAALAVKWLVGFLNRRGVGPFGWYRVVLAGVIAIALLSGTLQWASPEDAVNEPAAIGDVDTSADVPTAD